MPPTASAFAPFADALHENPGDVDPAVYVNANSSEPTPRRVVMAVLWATANHDEVYSSLAIEMATRSDADRAVGTPGFCAQASPLVVILQDGDHLAMVASHADGRAEVVQSMAAAIQSATGAHTVCPTQAS